jgi:hypothetical protein
MVVLEDDICYLYSFCTQIVYTILFDSVLFYYFFFKKNAKKHYVYNLYSKYVQITYTYIDILSPKLLEKGPEYFVL